LFFTEGWNIFDLIIVLISLIELSLRLADTEGIGGIGVLRLFRVFRVLRLVVYVERLNVIVSAFILALRSVAWVGVLLVIMVYMFAVIACGLFYKNKETLVSNVPDVALWFGSVPRSMATLLQMATYDGWALIVRPIGNEEPIAWAFFLLWLVLAAVGLLNLLTAVFLEALMEASKEAQERDASEKAQNRTSLLMSLGRLFHHFDFDKSGDLDKEEAAAMLKLFENEEFVEHLKNSGISAHKVREAVRYADRDGDGRVDYGEFIDALETMDETTAKRDTWDLEHKVRELDNCMETQHHEATEIISRVWGDLDTELDVMAKCVSSLGVLPSFS